VVAHLREGGSEGRGTALADVLFVCHDDRQGATSLASRRSDPAAAERLAVQLAATEQRRLDAVRSLTFGAFLTSQWLPAKKLATEIAERYRVPA
jgi:hypothetical protein